MEKEDGGHTSDLEDGEIRDDALEDISDISDCSMSEIDALKKNLEDEEELDLDILREEALKSMYNEDENDEEIEEEQCRLEALKSLLKNIELTEELASSGEVDKRRRPKKKRKHDSKHQRKKSKAVTQAISSSEVLSTEDCKRQRLSPLPRQNVSSQRRKSSNQKVELLPSRPWYPVADLTLIPCLSFEEDGPKVDVKSSPVRQTIAAPQVVKTKLTSYATQVSPSKNRVIKNNVDKLPSVKSNCFRKVTKHCIRKFNSTTPMNGMNSYASRSVVDKGKYKLVNKSNYVINKLPTSKVNGFHNLPSIRSQFSVNRLKNPKISSKTNEFIIEIGDDDSDNDEVISCCSSTKNTSVCDIKTSVETCTAEQPKQAAVNCDEIESNSSSSEVLASKDNVPEVPFEVDRKGDVSTCQEVERESTTDQEPSSSNAETITASVDNAEPIVKIERSEEKTEPPVVKVEPIEAPKEQVAVNGKVNTSVLSEAEAYVLKIREKLVSDLDELNKTLKQNDIECEKLSALSKKLCRLKSLVKRYETKTELQRSRLAANSAWLNCLYNGVQTRILTCSKFEEVCFTVGRSLKGSRYQPPNNLKSVIAEKRQGINFTKCQSVAASK